MTRLIDADAFWASVVQSRKETIVDNDVKISMGEFVKLLDNAPTVELFCSYLSDGEVKQPCVEAPCNHETQKDDDLCETCRYGDTCGRSDKGVSFAKHSKCWKWEADDDD